MHQTNLVSALLLANPNANYQQIKERRTCIYHSCSRAGATHQTSLVSALLLANPNANYQQIKERCTCTYHSCSRAGATHQTQVHRTQT